MVEFRPDKQRELEDIIEWWSYPLGLNNHRIEVKYGETVTNTGENIGEAWISQDYPQMIVGVREDSDDWRSGNLEEVAVHELVHALIQPLHYTYLDLLEETDLPSSSRNVLTKTAHRLVESAVERITLALVTVAQADRNGPAPSIGGIVKREEAA